MKGAVMTTYVMTEQHGGNGGNAFTDDLTQSCRLVKVSIRHGSEVDGIQGTYLAPSGAEFTGAFHGGAGGSLDQFTLAPGEYITRIDGRSGGRTDQLKFTTSNGNVYGPYGGDGGTTWSITNVRVGGFFGRSGARLDAIGFFTPGECK
jgi:Jacalin-like lectin domain